MQRWHRIHWAIWLAIAAALTLATSARAAGLLLYEVDARDVGTASARRAATAADASTAAANPAGMTLLDRTQLMASPGALLPFTNFDLAPQTTTSGGERRQRRRIFAGRRILYVYLDPDRPLSFAEEVSANTARRAGLADT